MIARIELDSAFKALFERNVWIWIKAPVVAWLAWGFFLPTLWKMVLLLVASVVCTFSHPCMAGNGVKDRDLWFMLVTHGSVAWLGLAYVAYVFAYLQHPGNLNVVMIFSALAILFIGGLFGVPFEELWAYLDSWTPIQAWRVVR